MTNRPPLLVLITNNYPFEHDHGEVMFVHPEISSLADTFPRVIVVPAHPFGPNLDPDNGCEIDLTFAKALDQRRLASFLRLVCLAKPRNARCYVREVVNAWSTWGYRGAVRAIAWSLQAVVAQEWVQSRFDPEQAVLFYTYWNNGITKGLCEVAREIPKWRVVTRVHRYDLYHNEQQPPYLPFRPLIYSLLDCTFAISSSGVNYLLDNDAPRDRVGLARLGTPDPGFRVRLSADGTLRVVSCSFLAPVKRVSLIAQALCHFASENPGVVVEWHHLGDGPERLNVMSALASAPRNLKAVLHGRLSHEEVLDYYRQYPSDLFVQLSSSEGIPVVMMEACSVGLPILATQVGGVGEIVTATNGLLLNANCSVAEVASQINHFYRLPAERKIALRAGSRTLWENCYRARTNHATFSTHLLAIAT